MFKGGQKGFTLIELLIVIVILGVLAAAIIPNLSKFMGSGTLGAANAELASVRTGVAAYQAEHNGISPISATVDNATVDVPAVLTGFVVNSAIQGYITGATIKADYNYTTASGVLTGVNGTYATGINWDATNACWYKP